MLYFPPEVKSHSCKLRHIMNNGMRHSSSRKVTADLRRLIDWVPGVVWSANAETLQFDYVSAQAVRLLGYPLSAWYEPDFWANRLHPNDRERATAFCLEQTRAGTAHSFEYRLIARDGHTVWVRDVVNVISEGGRPRRLYGVMIDITEKVIAQEDALRAETRFRAILSQTRLGVLILENDGAWHHNAALERMAGASGDAVLSTLEGLAQRMRALFRSGAEVGKAAAETVMEIEIRRRDEKPISLSCTAQPVWLDDTRPALIVALIEDATAHRSTQRQLTEGEKKARRLVEAVEAASEAVVICGLNGAIEYVNPAFERVTGYGHEEVQGKKARMLLRGLHGRSFPEQMWSAVTAGKPWSGRLRNRRRDGSFHESQTSITPIRGEDGKPTGYVSVSRDIREYLHAAEKGREDEELRRLGKLVSGVAHEVRNPLNAIRTAAAALELDRDNNEDSRALFSVLSNQIGRLATLMKDLLELGRPIEETHFRRVDIGDLIRSAVSTWRDGFRGSAPPPVRLEPTPRALEVWGDEFRLEGAVVNLLDNAARHNPPGEALRVEASLAGSDVRISVRDRGPGIKHEHLSRVFEPFFTTVKGGTGLGLTLVRNTVTQHGGEVLLRNHPEGGCEAAILLPNFTRSTKL